MTRLAALLLVVAIGVGVGAAIVTTRADVVPAHALPAAVRRHRPWPRRELPPRARAPRGRDLHGVEVRCRRGVAVGCDRADAAPPRDGGRDRRADRRVDVRDVPTCTTPSSTSATGRGTSGTCWTSTTATSARRSRPTTAARGTSTAASSTPRRRRTSTASASSRRRTRGPTATSSAPRRRRGPSVKRWPSGASRFQTFWSIRRIGQCMTAPPKSSAPAAKTFAPAAVS